MTYAYDAANQLLSEVRYGLRSYSNTFTYDPSGNQISVTPANGQPTTNTYNAANAVVLSKPGAGGGQPTTFTYDAAGNRLSKLAAGVPTTYTWDYENRNTLTYPSGQVPLTNLYDAAGLRRNDGTNTYVWDGQNVLQMRGQGTGSSRINQFTFDPDSWGNLISQYEYLYSESQFYGFDLRGDNRISTHGPGDVTAIMDYTAFGNE
jgi:YD repeat-containing protein